MEVLFKRFIGIGADFAYDSEATKEFSTVEHVLLAHISAVARTVFERHGAIDAQTPLLMPLTPNLSLPNTVYKQTHTKRATNNR